MINDSPAPLPGKLLFALAFFAIGALVALFLLRFTGSMEGRAEVWDSFCRRFITAEGRVVDDVNGSISHSEGQGYALVLAAHHDDRATFDRVWKWTRKNLQIRGEDHLLAWRWEKDAGSGGRVTDLNNASDGDVLVAWGLCRAYDRWGDRDHLVDALLLCRSLRERTVRASRYGTVMVPGVHGFDHPDGVVVNLSYWVFPAFRDLAGIDPEGGFWDELARVGKQLLMASAFGEEGLPPDWLKVSDPLRPADSFEPVFGYNAIRIPLHLAWVAADDPEARRLLKPYARLVSRHPTPARIPVAGPPIEAEDALPGMREILGLANSVTVGAPLQLPGEIDLESGYYSCVLQLLARCAWLEVGNGRLTAVADPVTPRGPSTTPPGERANLLTRLSEPLWTP